MHAVVPTKTAEVLTVYVRKKSHARGGSDYHQLVENRRVEGRPRQKVVMHLGSHATVDEALELWPREISGLRRSGYSEAAGKLRAKLDRLRRLRDDGVV